MSIGSEIKIPEDFESERLTIRAPRVRDAAELRAAIEESIDDLRPWMPWAARVPTLREARANLRQARRRYLEHKDFRLNLFLKGTDTFVGGSGIHRVNWGVRKVEIGYWVRRSFAGQGYITEAVNAITEFAVEHFGAKRVEIRMDDRNLRSWRVAERCGFELEGVLRNERRGPDGSLGDTRVYARVFGE